MFSTLFLLTSWCSLNSQGELPFQRSVDNTAIFLGGDVASFLDSCGGNNSLTFAIASDVSSFIGSRFFEIPNSRAVAAIGIFEDIRADPFPQAVGFKFNVYHSDDIGYSDLVDYQLPSRTSPLYSGTDTSGKSKIIELSLQKEMSIDKIRVTSAEFFKSMRVMVSFTSDFNSVSACKAIASAVGGKFVFTSDDKLIGRIEPDPKEVRRRVVNSLRLFGTPQGENPLRHQLRSDLLLEAEDGVIVETLSASKAIFRSLKLKPSEYKLALSLLKGGAEYRPEGLPDSLEYRFDRKFRLLLRARYSSGVDINF